MEVSHHMQSSLSEVFEQTLTWYFLLSEIDKNWLILPCEHGFCSPQIQHNIFTFLNVVTTIWSEILKRFFFSEYTHSLQSFKCFKHVVFYLFRAILFQSFFIIGYYKMLSIYPYAIQ